MEVLWQDLRYGARMILKRPVFTAGLVTILALGIGANSVIFSVVSAALLHPVPWKESERLVNVWETNPKRGENNNLVSASNFVRWREQAQSFEQVAGWRFLYLNLTGRDEPERVQGLTVSPNYFSLLGIQVARGRAFLPEEEQPGQDKVVILSQGLWQRRFGADPNLIGQQIMVEGEPRTVVGILPPDFRIFRVLNRALDIFIPLTLDRAQLERHAATASDARSSSSNSGAEHLMFVYARLKHDASIEQAQAEMNALYQRLDEDYPQTDSGIGVRLVSLSEQWGERARPALLMLIAAVAFVLLIACANAANLLLARAATRRREMTVRAVLGASRLRLVRQLLTESLLLAVVGGGAGLLLAFWGASLLNNLIPYTALNRADEFRLDPSVLVFTLIITLLTGLACGLAPALRSSKLDLAESLKASGKNATASRREGRLRNLLVVSEIALAVVLLIGAGLMLRSIIRLHTVDRGLRTNHVLTMQTFLPEAKYPTGQKIVSFYQQALERVQALPGVESASVINYPPLGLISLTVPFTVEGVATEAEEAALARYAIVSPEYFRTMSIPIIAGRPFTEQDADEAPGVVIISRSMARRYWPHEDALGKQIRLRFPEMKAYWIPESQNRSLTIVGVVGDIRQDGIVGAPQREATPPQMYLPYLQNPSRIMHLLIHTQPDPLSLAATVRAEIYAIDKDQPVSDVKTMDEVIAESFSGSSIVTLLLGAFAVLALTLAIGGIYCVTAYTVTERTREIGIRMALGAQASDVLKLVVGQGMVWVLIGVLIGLGAALAVTRVMKGLLYEVGANDPATFISVTALLTVVALIACYVPSRRAARLDPIAALRDE